MHLSGVDSRDGWQVALRRRLATARLDENLRRRTSAVVVDDLAAMVYSGEDPVAFAFARSGADPNGEASVVGGGYADRARAAQMNAVLAGWDELDEGYRRAACHGGLYTVPAAMAECEADGRTLDELLLAVMVGYETVATLARSFDRETSRRVHPHSFLAPIGAAATIAWVRTGDADTVVRAAETASVLAPRGENRLAHQGVLARNLWAGAGAVLGFLAANATIAGISGDPEYLEEVMGRPDDEGAPPWAVLDGYHKAYAACQYTHSAIEAAHSVVAGSATNTPIDTRRIRAINVSAHPRALDLATVHPTTSLGGKFSLPHVVAATIATARTDPDVYSVSFVTHPDVVRLRSLVHLEPFVPLPPYPHDRPARVSIELDDGTRVEATTLTARGEPERPLTEAQLISKIADLTSRRAPRFAATAASIMDGTLGGDTPWKQVAELLLTSKRGESR